MAVDGRPSGFVLNICVPPGMGVIAHAPVKPGKEAVVKASGLPPLDMVYV